MERIEIYESFDLLELVKIKSILNENNIEFFILNEFSFQIGGSYKSGIHGVSIKVYKKDEEAARNLLKKENIN